MHLHEYERDWCRVKDTLQLMSPTSGATAKEAESALIGVTSALMDVYQTNLNSIFGSLMRFFPEDFRVSSIPKSWIGIPEYPPICESDMVSFQELWLSLPESERTDDVRHALIDKYLYIVGQAFRAAERAKKPFIKIQKFHESGSQHIAYFEIFDKTLPDDPSRMNFHGQNVSQWMFAGCILVDGGRVSIHT